MVTEDSKIVLHRFNWQRLWIVSPGKCITSLCWRPDGKAIAVGLEDGTISLHDVEVKWKVVEKHKSHTVAVVCLNWEEDGTKNAWVGDLRPSKLGLVIVVTSRLTLGAWRRSKRGDLTKASLGDRLDDRGGLSTYEDRTSRFFPPAPRVPRTPGVVSGDTGFMDETEDSFRELSNSSHQRFNILCSGDKDGSICFSIFGIFPIGKVVALAKDLCHLMVICSGELLEDGVEPSNSPISGRDLAGLHCLVLDTSIFWKRKNELHQVAQQASNIEDLTEVIRASLSVMCKQWSDAMHTFHEKFDSLSTLIIDHGLDSTPQEEFLSLLGGARTSPPVHQFLVNSLGEAGLKRVGKVVCGAGKELQLIVLDHLQPAVEIIGFRIGELRGLSKWRARFQGIGLDEMLMSNATEKAGILLIQVERFMRVLSSVVQQHLYNAVELYSIYRIYNLEVFQGHTLLEPSDQLPPFSSELVIMFLKFLYDQDPVRQFLELSEVDQNIEIDVETMKRLKQLVTFGGFSDTGYLQRTLAKEFQQMESCFKEAFQVPFTTISKKIIVEDFLPLFPIASSPKSASSSFPTSISYYQEASEAVTSSQTLEPRLVDYISFRIPDESISNVRNCLGIVRGFMHELSNVKKGNPSLEAVLLCVPDGYHCVDLCLYKDSVMYLQMENEKVRSIPHYVIAPLAVSGKCFSSQITGVCEVSKRIIPFMRPYWIGFVFDGLF
ncbi:hypothetical protein C3L33_06293, partial [Rhododendron williamsianum]